MEAERGWRDRTERMWGSQTRYSTLSPTQKWINRATQLFALIRAPYVMLGSEFSEYEALFQRRLDLVHHHNVYSVVGAAMVLTLSTDPGENTTSWRFSPEKFKKFQKDWTTGSSTASSDNVFTYLRAYTTLFQIMAYVSKLQG